MSKVFIVHGGMDYHKLFKSLGFSCVNTLEEANLICFTGGEDVSPELYGEANVRSFSSKDRDHAEKRLFDWAVRNKVKMVGICRGGQFLNVMNGGKMWQDVNGHTHDHKVVDLETGEEFVCSSTHHQMMRPASHGKVVAIASDNRSTWFINAEGSFDRGSSGQDYDIEGVYYKDTNSLCFQPHPEFYCVPECKELFSRHLKHYLGLGV